MTVSNKVLIAPVLLAASQTTLYTAPTGAKSIIDKATVTNIHASNNVTISVNIVDLGDTASTTNLLVDARVIAVGETYTLPEMVGHNLATGDFISVIAGGATSLSLRVSGREIT
jgi:hypothetical protein